MTLFDRLDVNFMSTGRPLDPQSLTFDSNGPQLGLDEAERICWYSYFNPLHGVIRQFKQKLATGRNMRQSLVTDSDR